MVLKATDLHQYQRNIANHILTNKSSFILAECGLGKTVSALSAVSRLEGRVLVLAPLRVCHTSWPEEIAKWEHTRKLSYEIIHGSREAYKFDSKARIHITNYESLPNIMAHVEGRKHLPWRTLILDESSKVKSHSTQRFKMLKKLRSGFSRIILMTGTPCPNSLMELWSQLYILDGGERLDTAFGRFKTKYFFQPNPYRKYEWQPKVRAKRQIQEKVQDITISLKAKDYLELPPVVYNEIPVKLDKISMDVYKQLAKEFFLRVSEDNVVTASNAAILSSKLRQVLQGSIYTEDKSEADFNRAKVEALADLVEDSASPILCAYEFNFEKAHIKEKCPYAEFLTGNIGKDTKILKRWNEGKIRLLCVHPKSAAHGLNMHTGGHTIVWLALSWSLENYIQMNKRIDRQGQKNTVIIHHIVCRNTIDDRVSAVLKSKEVTQEEFLNNLKKKR